MWTVLDILNVVCKQYVVWYIQHAPALVAQTRQTQHSTRRGSTDIRITSNNQTSWQENVVAVFTTGSRDHPQVCPSLAGWSENVTEVVRLIFASSFFFCLILLFFYFLPSFSSSSSFFFFFLISSYSSPPLQLHMLSHSHKDRWAISIIPQSAGAPWACLLVFYPCSVPGVKFKIIWFSV